MTSPLQQDLADLAALLERAKTESLAYLNALNTLKTSNGSTIDLTDNQLPTQGIGALSAVDAFNERLRQLIVASSGPRYWGFVIGGTTPASIVGDWLATVFDQCSFATAGQGDISATIELETIQLLRQLFNLPDTYLGGFVSGATMSNFTCLTVARQWAGQQLGADIANDGMVPGITVLSAEPHASAVKSLAMLGIGRNNVTRIKYLDGNREAMDVSDLADKLKNLNGQPAILISSAGTVNTVDFDDMVAIGKLKETYKFWWHVDGAFGGFAACSPAYQHLVVGWEQADSITIDCHKWLNVPYDSAIFFMQAKHRQLHVETLQPLNSPYLGDLLTHVNYQTLVPESSRRLRALPAWFSLMAYGKAGYQAIVETNIRLAQSFGEKLANSDVFELLAPVRLNTVCFSLRDAEPEQVKTFLTTLNNTGLVFMTPTVYRGRAGIRAAFVNWRTTDEDVAMVFEEMVK
ncbi:pyridoxal phosphate-dependent decarboxylase family protein [Spirosoma pollinicola]|uniref:Aspartate aminotransferase family protein n=1 Tax=Spirosoma pollinicola TaxID=2057025 RepID=A0A2K8Z4I8_9BACT|nr:pyridoxal-dependent decarboxylase [Spirosoma pollinicola]AUD04793.1 aspartate aminotransferase family protein [Spirosoma pollinicola]